MEIDNTKPVTVSYYGVSQIMIEYSPLVPDKMRLLETNLRLEISGDIEPSSYYNPDGLTNGPGTAIMQETFIQGIIGCIHIAHENGYKDSAENLREIIDKLTDGFSRVMNISKGTMLSPEGLTPSSKES